MFIERHQEGISIPVSGDEGTKDPNTLDTAIKDACREVFSFLSAVRQMYGEEEATIALDDWLDILDEIPTPRCSSAQSWRLITISAASRLATRICQESANGFGVDAITDSARIAVRG